MLHLALLTLLMSPHPTDVVLTWVGGNDYYTLTLTRAGEATYQVHAGGHGLPATPPPPKHGKLEPGELERLRKLLEQNRVLSLSGSSRHPVPEEREDSLTVSFDDWRGSVSMLANEWGKTARGRACERALDSIANRIAEAKERYER